MKMPVIQTVGGDISSEVETWRWCYYH